MRKQLPALVIMDLSMPDMDGAEMLAQIREQWEKIPVLILGGYPEGDLMDRAPKSAPFTVLAKPAAPEQILNTVRTLLARSNHGKQSQPAAVPREDPVPETGQRTK